MKTDINRLHFNIKTSIGQTNVKAINEQTRDYLDHVGGALKDAQIDRNIALIAGSDGLTMFDSKVCNICIDTFVDFLTKPEHEWEVDPEGRFEIYRNTLRQSVDRMTGLAYDYAMNIVRETEKNSLKGVNDGIR